MKFHFTFTPTAAAGRRKTNPPRSICYPVTAINLAEGERIAEAMFASENRRRSDFNKVLKCQRLPDEAAEQEAPQPIVEQESQPTLDFSASAALYEPKPFEPEREKPDLERQPVKAAVNDDDWGDWGDLDFAPAAPAWTIDSLNARLEQLAPSETLVIDNLSDEIYHGSNGISCSKIKLFLECPQKYHAKYNLGICRETEKAYFDFGKAAHCALLEPWRLDEFFIRQPDEIKVRNSKAWTEFKAGADAAGQTVLTANQWDDVQVILNADKPKALRELITGGICERSIFKRDAETGLIIKVRPDYTIGRLITDLKTCADGEPHTFSRNAKKLGYHIQDAMYTDVSGAEFFVFIAIESASPFVVTAPIVMDSDAKRLGFLQYRKALREIKQCMETGIWPPYTTDHVSVSLNQWEKQQLEALEAEVLALEHKDHAA